MAGALRKTVKRKHSSSTGKRLSEAGEINVTLTRCKWVPLGKPVYVEYHDTEWGVPLYDSRGLFEMLVLEGFQAGLSWETILNKRAHYRTAFANFEAAQIALYTGEKSAELLCNANIVRNRLKIAATISNAQAYLELTKTQSFSDYIWAFSEHKVVKNSFESLSEIPSQTPLSAQMSKQLKKDGFKFVGPTICYAFMQAVGIVNDHSPACFRYSQV